MRFQLFFFNMPTLSSYLRYTGNEFQSFGPPTEKALSPAYFCRLCGISSVGPLNNLVEHLLFRNTISLCRYSGACVMHLNTWRIILYLILDRRGNQCRDLRVLLMWSNLRFPVIRRAQACCNSCNFSKRSSETPYKRAFQYSNLEEK